MKKRQPQPRRISRAEADAQVAHIPEAERQRILAWFIGRLAAVGVRAEIVPDATGRTFLALDLAQVRERCGPELAAELEAAHLITPLPIWQKPQKARTA